MLKRKARSTVDMRREAGERPLSDFRGEKEKKEEGENTSKTRSTRSLSSSNFEPMREKRPTFTFTVRKEGERRGGAFTLMEGGECTQAYSKNRPPIVEG